MNKVTLYHGSKSDFDKFSLSFVRAHGLGLGYGIYFTDIENLGISYAEGGILYKCEVQLHGELHHDIKTITRQQYKDIIVEVNDKYDLLSNYGEIPYESYNTVLNRALEDYDLSDNDLDLIGAICNTCGVIEDVLNIVFKLTGKNYCKVYREYDDKTLESGNIYVLITTEHIKILIKTSLSQQPKSTIKSF